MIKNRKFKDILFTLLIANSILSHSSGFTTGLIIGQVTGTASASSAVDGDVFVSRKFDYAIACSLEYKEATEGSYEYFCPNPPASERVLFMSTIFNNSYWPSKIIYYMKRN